MVAFDFSYWSKFTTSWVATTILLLSSAFSGEELTKFNTYKFKHPILQIIDFNFDWFKYMNFSLSCMVMSSGVKTSFFARSFISKFISSTCPKFSIFEVSKEIFHIRSATAVALRMIRKKSKLIIHAEILKKMSKDYKIYLNYLSGVSRTRFFQVRRGLGQSITSSEARGLRKFVRGLSDLDQPIS